MRKPENVQSFFLFLGIVRAVTHTSEINVNSSGQPIHVFTYLPGNCLSLGGVPGRQGGHFKTLDVQKGKEQTLRDMSGGLSLKCCVAET